MLLSKVQRLAFFAKQELKARSDGLRKRSKIENSLTGQVLCIH